VILCVQLPRFSLTVEAGGAVELARRPLALAPSSAITQHLGEVSGSAQAVGVSAGMALGEALARCPELVLVPEDPIGVTQAWEESVRALEGIGAAIETTTPGIAYFDVDGLLSLHRHLQGLIAATRHAVGHPARIGGGPTRFCAVAAVTQSRPRRARLIEPREAKRYLAAQPVAMLAHRSQTVALVAPLERLGVRTLGELAALGAAAVADRFGRAGSLARALALGEDEPLRTRQVEDELSEAMPVSETNSGEALQRVLGVLVDRMIARPQRRARTIRAVMMFAALVERGTWRERVVFREATSDATRLRLALCTRLALLPAPAETLGVTVVEWGPALSDQQDLLDDRKTERLAGLANVVDQTRSMAGPYAVLRIVQVDPHSRVPERRYTYSPYLK
jgi:protein ImuB